MNRNSLVGTGITAWLCLASVAGCAFTDPAEREIPANQQLARMSIEGKLSPQQSREVLDTVHETSVYGSTIGEVTLKIAGSILFPPYGIYLLSRSVGKVAGADVPEATAVLPADEKRTWDAWYDDIASGPGRLAAAIAGQEYRTKERIDEDWEQLVDRILKQQDSKQGFGRGLVR